MDHRINYSIYVVPFSIMFSFIPHDSWLPHKFFRCHTTFSFVLSPLKSSQGYTTSLVLSMEIWRILSAYVVLDSLQIFSYTVCIWICFIRISISLRVNFVIQIWQYCSLMIWIHYVVRSDRTIPLDCRVQAKIQVTFTIIRPPPTRSLFWCSHRWYRDL